jgi:hypothetical protein
MSQNGWSRRSGATGNARREGDTRVNLLVSSHAGTVDLARWQKGQSFRRQARGSGNLARSRRSGA